MKNVVTVFDIGEQVQTPDGLGILLDVDAGGVYYVLLHHNDTLKQYEISEIDRV